MSRNVEYVHVGNARKWSHIFYFRHWRHRLDQIEWLRDQELPDLWRCIGQRVYICDDNLALAFKIHSS